MNAHPKIQIAAFDGKTVKPRAVPQNLDAILDELAGLSKGDDAMAQRIVEGTVKNAPPRKSERWGREEGMSPDWINTAKVGDKVTRIPGYGAAADKIGYGFQFAEFGIVYTIREIYVWRGVPHILLEEVVNPICDVNGDELEPAFPAEAFRPVEPRKTDISIFTDILKKADKPVEEDA